MSLRSTFVTLGFLAALAAPSAALESVSLKLKTGGVVRGLATAYDAKTQVLSFKTEDGQAKQFPLDQLDARSAYLVHASLVPKDNGKGQLQLANLARDAGLYAHAARRYGYAESADPSLKAEVERERTELRHRAAEFCLANAKSAQAKGDKKETEKWLSLLLEKLPNEPQAAEAAAMMDATYKAEAEARDDELEKKHQALLQKDLKQGKQRYDSMLERTRQGLTARSESTSENLWKGALADGEFVLKKLDRLKKKYADDAKVQDGAVRYRKLTVDQMVDLHLHLASQYTTKGKLNDALREANAALALDPESAEASAARARIENAANQGIIRWW